MMQLRLSNDRTEVDMDVLATAFGLSREALDDALSLGAISYCYELGPGDTATPRTVFRSTRTEQRVTLDRIGRIMFPEDTLSADQPLPCSEACRPDAATARAPDAATPGDTTQASGESPQQVAERRLDALLDEALRESFPASDPIAISFDVPHRGS
jgi:hypothetical protein